MATSKSKITEGLYTDDLWNPFDFHLSSYVKSPLQLRYVSTKTSIIGRALRHAIVDLLDHLPNKSIDYIENETTVLGTEHRLYYTRNYTLKVKDDDIKDPELNDNDEKVNFEISALAPTIFSQLREDIGIATKHFRQSFFEHHLKDFTNPGKSGSLMYKTHDDLFILKTLRSYEARLLMQILSGYHLQLTQRSTLFNRYLGLYSVRLPNTIPAIEIFIVIMANAFTPSLRINEIFDLKGSTIKRKITGQLSIDKLHKLKDVDFTNLYPYGIRIPTHIYEKLKIVIANDVKVLKKLNVTDFSLILGIRHIDMTDTEMMQRRPTSGVAALFYMSNSIGLMEVNRLVPDTISPKLESQEEEDLTNIPISYLRPIDMLSEQIDTNYYYDNDLIAYKSLPIPGIINRTNQRVYLYLAFVDMLQTFDSVKHLDQAFRKLTDYNRRLEYSVIEPEDYEKRINQFLFKHVFIDAQNDFPWPIDDINKNNDDLHKEQSQTLERENSDSSILEIRL